MFFKKKKKESLRDDLAEANSKVRMLGLGSVTKGLNKELTDTETVTVVSSMARGKGGGVGCLTTKRFIYASKALQDVDILSIPLDRITTVESKNTMTGEKLTISTAKTDYEFTHADREFAQALKQAAV